MTPAPIPFLKGHGTGNDFVLLPNLEGTLRVSPRLVAALCDRRRGIGADGVLIVARTAAEAEVADQAGLAPYFMDYRNADGTVAEMCGNGARVFVAHLREAGLVEGGTFHIATRGGPRRVHVDAATRAITVGMGPAELADRTDLRVSVDRLRGPQPAMGVHLPNPHAVTWVESLTEAGRLLEPPRVTPPGAFPDGVNVEFVVERAAEHVEMRVFERGVGETLSCGTGACAAAVATLARRGEGPAGQRVTVDVPGGRLEVAWLPDGEVELTGPTRIVGRGTLEPDWWADHA